MLEVRQNLVELAAEACARHADRVAFTCLEAGLSFRDLDAKSSAFARWLLQQQLGRGERVALLLPNLLQYPVAALGVMKAGGIIVNMNPLYTGLELEQQLNDSGARILVTLANTAHVVARVIAATPVEHVVVTEVGDMHPWYRRIAINWVLRYIKKAVPAFAFPVQTGFRRALAQGQGADAHPFPATAIDDVAVLQYTGGTTGKAKGAMLSHRNLASNVYQVMSALADTLPAGSLMVAPLPLYHVYAFTMNLLGGIALGHNTLLIPNPRDIPAFVRALKSRRINGFAGINTLYKALCGNKDFCALDFSALRISSSGGMALEPQVARRWEEITGSRIIEGYGLTECSPLVACHLPGTQQTGSVGWPVKGTSIVIKDAEGRVLPAGEPGEVCIKGPQVMQGYWQQPAESARVFDAEGWLHSGDMGVIDADGSLRIVDRIKDLIIVSGFNVYPNEIEDHVRAHPDIVEAAVIGTGDEYSARVTLFVVTRGTALSEQEVLAWCREGLAPYKVPKLVEFRDSLPKSNVGKVLRRELRSQLVDRS